VKGEVNEPGGGTEGELKRMADRMNAISEKLRGEKLNPDPIKMNEKTGDGLGGMGRGFNEDEKQRLQEQAKKAGNQPGVTPVPNKNPEEQNAQKKVQGKSRDALTKGEDAGEGRVRTTPDQENKDVSKKMGELKPLPEYRNAVDEYYKTILK